jgi:hypothetical protein
VVQTVGTSVEEPVTAAELAAVEVELSKKATRLLVEKLHWYAVSAAYTKVVYLCGDTEVRRAIARAAGQAASNLDLHVIELEQEFLDAVVSRQSKPAPRGAGTLVALLGFASTTG